jgi:HKD family nuclease
MKILSQYAGNSPLYKVINEELVKKDVVEFKILMSYLNWGGLELIHENLEKFYDNGGKINFIVGLGNNADEIDVLKYLKERMPKGSYKVFNTSNSNFIFHPKLYYFKGKQKSSFILGSNNFTLGGLNSNSELSLKFDGESTMPEFKNILDVWLFYSNPKPPFSKKNLIEITKIQIDKLTKLKKSKDQNLNVDEYLSQIKDYFGEVKITQPEKRKKVKKQQPNNLVNEGLKDLFLQVLEETGGGQQVQIPSIVANTYFSKKSIFPLTIQIKFKSNGYRPVVIQKFNNHTIRFNIHEISDLSRPLLLHFEKQDTNKFIMKALSEGEYKSVIKKCTNQTRYGSKKWIIK